MTTYTFNNLLPANEMFDLLLSEDKDKKIENIENIEKKHENNKIHQKWLRSYKTAWVKFYDEIKEEIAELFNQLINNTSSKHKYNYDLKEGRLLLEKYTDKIGGFHARDSAKYMEVESFKFDYYYLHKNNFKIDETQNNPETFWNSDEKIKDSVFKTINDELSSKGYMLQQHVSFGLGGTSIYIHLKN